MFLIQWRNKNQFKVKILSVVAISLLVGGIFFKIGNDATRSLYQYSLFYISLIHFIYVPMMPLLVKSKCFKFFEILVFKWILVPLDMKYVKKEYFNKWYNIESYYLALTFSTLPDQLIFGTLYVVIVYILATQPLEVYCMLTFYGTLFLTAAITEAYALIICSFMNVRVIWSQFNQSLNIYHNFLECIIFWTYIINSYCTICNIWTGATLHSYVYNSKTVNEN